MTKPLSSPLFSTEQRAVLALWYEVNASLSAYHKLVSHFGTAVQAWSATPNAWQALGLHYTHLKRHEQQEQTLTSLDNTQQDISSEKYQLIFADQPEYPIQLLQIYDPPPLLFCRGNSARLQQAQIAMVGSRKPTAHAQKTTFDIAQYLAQAGYIITSGLALGVDKCAHLGALAQTNDEYQGRTVGVMGTGIDVYYPNHHDKLFAQIIEQGGCIISELLPHTPPHKHTFPRRNRLVAGLSLATIVTEAALKSGSLITARLTSEQGKQVFAIPSHIDNLNAEGCLHLIREGATLIYHPEQVIEDVNAQLGREYSQHSPNNQNSHHPDVAKSQSSLNSQQPMSTASRDNKETSKATQQTRAIPPIKVPEHLTALYELLDWHGQDLDALIGSSKLVPPQLLSQLMELELLGIVSVQGGRYLRV